MVQMSEFESLFCRTRLWRSVARRFVVPRVLDGGEVGPQVLEIGCGSGAMAAEVLAQRPGIDRYVATDVDPAMVRLARRELASQAGRAEAAEVDGARLPYGDGSFDTVCSWLMLHHTITWEDVVADAARVLRPGGRLVGYDLPDSPRARLVHRVTRSRVRMVAPEELARELVALGFESVEVEPLGVADTYRFSAVRPPG
ncbi:class I SAM-dependent methyltransferase [Nocardioides sp. R-C-SC26]|uniref:class I SAM-dependent methyltransferase n=1 Tax=Nocardioides sp. R-C-SC26 TaxID=2870414 RepID=UPI001E5ECC32|nr:class I SAM-dependent methyltransferase [Nocardioides sp. R-C-SC26]